MDINRSTWTWEHYFTVGFLEFRNTRELIAGKDDTGRLCLTTSVEATTVEMAKTTLWLLL